jgi:hypothetical protein
MLVDGLWDLLIYSQGHPPPHPTPPTLPDPPQTLLPRLHPDLSIVRGGLKDRGHARVSGWVGAAGAALGLIVAGP